MGIDNFEDILDVQDIITRVEELRAEWAESTGDDPDDYALSGDDLKFGLAEDDAEELETLTGLLEDLKSYGGGDVQWHGVWYPALLIRDSHFTDFAYDYAEQIGAIDADAGWPNNCIDWEKAAWELKMDYTSIEFDGVTYWTRS